MQRDLAHDQLARAVLQLLLDDPAYTRMTFFQTRWYNNGEFAYPDEWMTAALKAGLPLWKPWITEITSWLQQHPEDSQATAAVLSTLNIALRVRDEDNEWDMVALSSALQNRLKDRFSRRTNLAAIEHPQPTTSTQDLLAYLVLAGGEIWGRGLQTSILFNRLSPFQSGQPKLKFEVPPRPHSSTSFIHQHTSARRPDGSAAALHDRQLGGRLRPGSGVRCRLGRYA